jgi:hypothetical protein
MGWRECGEVSRAVIEVRWCGIGGLGNSNSPVRPLGKWLYTVVYAESSMSLYLPMYRSCLQETARSLLYVLSPLLPVGIRTVSIRIIRISRITLRISGRVPKQVSGKVRLIWCFARTRLSSVGRLILFKWELLDNSNKASIVVTAFGQREHMASYGQRARVW